MSITHLEVRRHPLWQKQSAADPEVKRAARVGLAVVVFGAVGLLTAVALLVFF